MNWVQVYSGVTIGSGAELGDFVVIGVPPRGAGEGEVPTRIGGDARIRSHTVIYAGNRIGDRFQTGHGAMVREYNEIGDDVSIGSGSIIEHHVKIGHRVRIHSMAFVPEFSVLEDDCWLGPHVVFTNTLFPLSPHAEKYMRGPTIRRGAKIGANATLLPGIVIGEESLIGAGSVVTHDVPPGRLFFGNPAKDVKAVTDLRYPEAQHVLAYD